MRAWMVAGWLAACGAAAGGEWLHSRGDLGMTGRSPTELRFPLELAWQFRMMPEAKGGEMLVASAVVRAGKVYAGCKDGKFFCLELGTGKKVWEAPAKGAFDGAAAFSGKLVIAGCQDGFVYAWDADTGKEAWKFETMAEIHAAAAVWNDPKTKKDLVVIGSYDNSIYGLDAATGKKLWSVETGNYVNGGAAIEGGVTAAGGCDELLHIVDVASGKELRQIEIGAYVGNNVALADGVAYVAHYGNRVCAFSIADRMKIWEYGERDFEYYAAPAVFEKIVLVGGRDKRFHAIDRVTGAGLWEFRARDRIDSSAVVCAGKSVIFGSDDGYLYALDLKTGKELWKYEIGAPVKASPAVAGDWVLIGADDGVLYAFKNAAAAR